MAATSRLKLPGGTMAWAGAGVATLVAIAAVAGIVMATQCVDGKGLIGSCGAPSADPIVTAAIEPVQAAEPRLEPEPQNISRVAMTVPAASRPAPATPQPSVDQVIDDTFKLLVAEVEPTPTTAPAASAEEEPALAYEEGDGPGPIRTPEPLEFPPLPASTTTAAPEVRVAATAEAATSPPAGAQARAEIAAPVPDQAVTVADGPLNVRSGPSQEYRKLFALKTGAEVTVNGQSSGWVQVTDERERTGWVDPAFLDNVDVAALAEIEAPAPEETKVASAEEPATDAATGTRRIGGSGVNVRSGPGKSNKRLFTLAAGETVTVLEDQRGWLKVKDDQGRTGWLYQSYLR